jgi:glycosyltransferase involved in cell wall biosynthesis
MVSEALMSGLPVVSFDVGAVNELIQNELAGSVIPNYDISAMADKILKLILNIEKINRESVKKTVFKKLSTASMVSNFESILA